MLLSNSRKSLIIIVITALAGASCGGNEPVANPTVKIEFKPTSEFPFPTREPDEYQAFAVVTAGDVVTKQFIARSGKRWRIDQYLGDQLAISEISNGKYYTVDHPRRLFAEQPLGTGNIGEIAPFSTDNGLFNSRMRYRFEEAGTEGSLTKYRFITNEDAAFDNFIWYDPNAGMVVRQEFSNGAVRSIFELREFQLQAPDELFNVPEGYTKTAIGDLRKR
jgi:hypothetical protein